MYEEPRQDNVLLIYMARAHGGALFDFSELDGTLIFLVIRYGGFPADVCTCSSASGITWPGLDREKPE